MRTLPSRATWAANSFLCLYLAAFRFFRVLLRLNNRNLFSHLIKVDALGPILDLTLRESRRDNLLSSTCQEFFEHMRKVHSLPCCACRCRAHPVFRRT